MVPGAAIRSPLGRSESVPGALQMAGATLLLTSASFSNALDIAADFRRRGDHMVTKRPVR